MEAKSQLRENQIINTIEESLYKLAEENTLTDTVRSLIVCEEIYRDSEVCSKAFYKSIRDAQSIMEFLGVESKMHPNEALAYVIRVCRKGMLKLEGDALLDPKTHCPKCGHFMDVV